MIGRREWGGEVVAHKIIPDEECVDPGETATNEGIALSPSQYFKRSERRTKIIRTIAYEGVGNRFAQERRQGRVVLDYD